MTVRPLLLAASAILLGAAGPAPMDRGGCHLPRDAALRAAAAPPPAAPAVTVAIAVTGGLAETVVVTGTLVPREEVLVSPQIDGLAITEIDAEEGDRVAAGQVLARLSHDTLDASLAQNAAQIAKAEASRAEADAAFARSRDLVKTGITSRETFDTRQASLQAAIADAALTRAQREELMVKLGYTTITAPVAGVVSRRVARLGSVVAMSGDPLFRIIEDGDIELEAAVPETALARLRVGQPARVTVTGLDPRDGRIRLVSPEVNAASRLGHVRVRLADSARLTIGGFGRAEIEIARHEGVLVPLSAVQFSPVEDSGALSDTHATVQVVRDGVVETRPVAIGLRAEGRAEITQGLAAGEQVVALSASFVRAGDRVTPVAAETARGR